MIVFIHGDVEAVFGLADYIFVAIFLVDICLVVLVRQKAILDIDDLELINEFVYLECCFYDWPDFNFNFLYKLGQFVGE